MPNPNLPPEEAPKPDSLMGLNRAMALLGMSRDKMKKVVADGAIKTVQVGRQAQVMWGDVQNLVRDTIGMKPAGDSARTTAVGAGETGGEPAADSSPLAFALAELLEALGDVAPPETLLAAPLGESVALPAPPESGDVAGDPDAILARRMAAALIRAGIESGADELHVEPMRHGAYIRMRTGDELTPVIDLATDVAGPLMVAIGDICQLPPLAEIYAATRSRCDVRFDSQRYCLRAHAIPTLHGPAIVCRLDDAHDLVPSLGEIGLMPAQLQTLQGVLFAKNSPRERCLIGVGSPAVADRTAFMYAVLRELAGPGKKIMTVESPVEVDLDGVVQISTGPDCPAADAVHALAIHRPHVVAVPEVRDAATLAALIELADAGVRVLAGLSCRDAWTTAQRFQDLAGRGQVQGWLTMAVALEMLPKLDPARRAPDPAIERPDVRAALGFASPEPPLAAFAGPKRGRIGIFSLLEMGSFTEPPPLATEWREAVLARLGAGEIRLSDARRLLGT